MADYLIKGETLTSIAEAIRSKTGGEDAIPVSDMAAQIEGITGGGGASEDVRYVTFMSEDGSVEYGKKAVAVGDDCADPIARGVFDTPTKESTAQYSYAHVGWATTPNGAWDETALDAVTEDRTVYAAYASAVRYYTISYYDGDTLLKSESLAYGSMPSYIPVKDGSTFKCWAPELVVVSGNMSYYAQFEDKITFSGSSWADISSVCERGEASEYFVLGDTRNIEFAYGGTNYTATVEIVAIDYDSKADGSGKAGITVCMKDTVDVFRIAKHTSNTSPDCHWPNCTLRTVLHSTVLPTFSEDLQSVIKPVTKITNGYSGSVATTFTSTDSLWIPSVGEIGGSSVASSYTSEGGDPFQKYASKKSKDYWLRTGRIVSGGMYSSLVRSTGTGTTTVSAMNAGTYVLFGFCI